MIWFYGVNNDSRINYLDWINLFLSVVNLLFVLAEKNKQKIYGVKLSASI